MPTLGVIIRFRDHESTLGATLDGLMRQRRAPDLIVGVDTGSTDGSADLLLARGARIVRWDQPYHPSLVLNHGIAHCPTDLVMILSAHYVLEQDDVIDGFLEAMRDERVACVSGREQREALGERVTWADLVTHGISSCTIYNNMCGVVRRARWEELPFDRRIDWIDDFAWAIEQTRRGWIAARTTFAARYIRNTQRPGHADDRIRVRDTARNLFAMANAYGLRMHWYGVPGTLRAVAWAGLRYALSLGRSRQAREELVAHRARLNARFTWRRHNPFASA
ncbi:MAG TPA: glycosyltransferase family 2 protein [Planctomycetota bacterium]|nr:glycosyltransferase family 2 protein [Planctomycetota bacterium]